MINRVPSRPTARSLTILIAILLGLGGLFALTTNFSSGESGTVSARDVVTKAWLAAKEEGAYHFTSDVIQVTVPEATLTNVGRRSVQEQIYLEGQTDLRDRSMNLRVWTDSLADGGSILIPESGMDVQIADGETQVRRGSGPWQDVTGFTDGYAPQGDFLAYLAAMQDVEALGTESSHGLTYTRYGFTVDGPAFALFSRNQMQEAMHANGELPPNMQLSVSDYQAKMTGDGELWIGEDGLPLRQILRLHFPAQDGKQISAQITANFYDYGRGEMSVFALFTQPAQWWPILSPYVTFGFALVLVLGGSLGLIFFRRRRLVEALIAVTMSLLLVLTPVMNTLPIMKFFGQQTALAAERADAQAEADIAESLRAISAENTFDPRANPLDKVAEIGPVNPSVAQAAAALPVDAECVITNGALDSDGDGLSDAEENALVPPTKTNDPDSDADGVNDCVEVKVWGSNPNNVDTDGDSLSDFQELGLGTDLKNDDSDNDGLTDNVELAGYGDPEWDWWYSDPLNADSNSDGVADLVERGPDPGRVLDTDGDGTPDLYDTDNDGDGVLDRIDLSPFTPVKPKENNLTYSGDKPLQVTLKGLTPGMPAYLDLQLRPLDDTHLRYAYTVLDWPTDRKGQIQDWDDATYAQTLVNQNVVSSVDDAGASDNYGDMRLTPNLEITISGTDGRDLSRYNLPPLKDLAPYNISVITTTVDGTPMGTPNGVKLYVPLSLVTDPEDGMRVAFRARIPYLRAGTEWVVPHKMRMVWTVQMLSDIPCDPTDAMSTAAGCATVDGSNPFLFDVPTAHAATLDAETVSADLRTAFSAAGHALAGTIEVTVLSQGNHWKVKDKDSTYLLRLQNGKIEVYTNTSARFFNQSQIVQRYEDEWFLTGANVSEDNGVQVGIFYEDPAVDTDLHSDDMLWSLSYALDDAFLTPSANTLSVKNLTDRFDRIANDSNGTTEEQRWSIVDGMRATYFTYPTADWAVARVAMTETKQLLTAFNPIFQSQGAITPTLLYAQSASSRAVGLDAIPTGGGYVSLSGQNLDINLAPTPSTALKADQVHSVKWSSFCAQPSTSGGAPMWASCDQTEYGYTLVDRYRGSLETEFPDAEEAEIDGRMIMMRLYYLSLWNGSSAVIRSNGSLVTTLDNPDTTDTSINGIIKLIGAGANGAAKAAAKKVGESYFAKPKAALTDLGNTKLKVLARQRNALLSTPTGLAAATKAKAFQRMNTFAYKHGAKIAVGLLIVTALAGELAKALSGGNQDVATGFAIATAVAGLAVATMGIYSTAVAVSTWAKVTSWATVLKGGAQFAGQSAKAAAIGAAVAIVVVWGFFIGSMVSSGTKVGSPAFNAGAAFALAMTIYLVVLAVLSASVVGLILVALLALIDGFFSLLCALDSGSKDALGDKNGDCTVGTKIVTAIAGYIYARDMIIETDGEKNPDLVKQGAPIVELRDPALGYVTGNLITFTVPVTTNIVHKNPDHWQISPYIYKHYDLEEFNSTTFKYTLSLQKKAFEVNRFEMVDQWRVTKRESAKDYSVRWTKLTAYATAFPRITDLKLSPGINQPIDYWFNMAYALPAYECWTIWTVPYCEHDTEQGGEPSFVNGPVYDIFPDTVSQFWAVAPSQGGYRLSWDSSFPMIWDADGDGLATSAKGGIDPNDNNPDTDYDGLSDRFELEQRMAGIRLSPNAPDSDGDGLMDPQEIQYGTNPGNADTDNDGLKDSEEVYHQVFELVGTSLQPKLDQYGNPVFAGGWTICQQARNGFGGVCMIVSSDPTDGDADKDGIPDDAEKRLYELYQWDANGQPYNPRVANVNPLQLQVSASVAPYTYLAPGSSFTYSTTVSSFADLDPGVLQVTLPGALGGTTELTQFTLAKNGSQTVANTYQVAAGAGSQPFDVESSARARLKTQNSFTTFAFNTSPGTWLGESTDPLRAESISGDNNRPDQPNSYMMGGLLSQSFQSGGKGNVVAYDPDGNPIALDADYDATFGDDNRFRRGRSIPGTACNDTGNCFVVWDRVDNCNTFTVHQLIVDQNVSDGSNLSGRRGIEPILYYFPNSDQSLAYSAGSVFWSADQYYKDMEAGNWAGGALGSATHRGLPLSQYFCDASAFQTSSQQIWAMESDANYSAGNIWVPGTGYNFVPPDSFVLRPDRMESQSIQLGQYSYMGGLADVIRVFWDVPKKQRNTIAGRIVGSSSDPAQLTHNLGTAGDSVGDFAPVVATDGDGFLVAWNQKSASYSSPNWTITSKILVRRFNASGAPTAAATQIWAGTYTVNGSSDYNTYGFVNYDAAFAHTEADVIPNVIWAGDRYRVVFAYPSTNTVNLLYSDIFASSSSSVATLFANNVPLHEYDRTNRPAMAYDPVNRRIMTVYHNSTNGRIGGLLTDLAGGTSTVIPQLTFRQSNNPPRASVAYYPAVQGWLVTFDYANGTQGYEVLNADGSSMDTELLEFWPQGQNLWGTGRSLMCPSPLSAPVVAMPFEEMPGATSFADVSAVGKADSYCSSGNCPVVGVAAVGIPNQPLADAAARPPRTDRALGFDGVNDNVVFGAPVGDGFTYSFWFKPDPTQINVGTNWWEGTPLLLANGTDFEALYGVSLGAENRILVGQGSKTATSSPIDMDVWHHVVLLRRPSSGLFVLYLDGQGIAGDTNTTQPVQNPQVLLGKFNDRYFRGSMDFVTVYATDMKGDTIGSLYKGELQSDLGYSLNPSYCILAGGAYASGGKSGFAWNKISVQRTLPRGEGPLQAQDSLSLWVDAVKPTSAIDSLAQVSYLKAPPAGRAGLAAETLIIGGSATDADSGISHVDVFINGATHRAEGQATWTVPFTYAAEGHYTLQSVAVDKVGFVETNSPTLTIIVDGKPPVATLTGQDITPQQSAIGRWSFPLSGQISDPVVNDGTVSPGSGVDRDSLLVILQSEDGQEVVNQPATLNGTNWSATLELPSDMVDPTGVYTATLLVADNVGNSTQAQAQVRLTVAKVTSAIDPASQVVDFITGPASATASRMAVASLSLSGKLTSTVALNSVDGLFIPIDQTRAFSQTVAMFNFDENPGVTAFESATQNGLVAYCGFGSYVCPTAGGAGQLDRGLTFIDKSLIQIDHTTEIDFEKDASFTIALWLNPTRYDAGLLEKNDGHTGYKMTLEQSGRVSFKFSGPNNSGYNLTSPSGKELVLNTWNHVALTYNAEQNRATFFINGEAVQSGIVGSGSKDLRTPANLRIGTGLRGVMDQLVISRMAMSADQIRSLVAMPTQSWQPGTLTQNGGPNADGEIGYTWSIPIPSGMESYYQLDLRATDAAGKRFRRPNLWRGSIDNLPPRITMNAAATGNLYYDPDSGNPRYDIAINGITAEDLNLATLSTPCGTSTQPDRGYIDEEWSQTFFPDGTLRNQLTVQCHVWAETANPTFTMSACDDYGQCATVNQGVSTANVPLRADATADPILIWPPAGSVVAMDQPLQLQIGGAPGGNLVEMGIMVNGQAGDMATYDPNAGVTQAVATVNLPIPAGGEGVYNMQVRTKNAAGQVVMGPVSSITLDTQDPNGAFITGNIESDPLYDDFSGIVRFSGTAGDSLGNGNVANVELSVAGAPFQDVTWKGDGTWSTAVSLGPNLYGKSYPVTLRVTDRAGRVTTEEKTVQVNIPAPEGYDPAAIPSLTIDDGVVKTSDSTAVVTIRLSAPLEVGTVSVHYTTADGTAVQGVDYTANSGTALIRAGESTSTIIVPIVNTGVGGAKTFTINLSQAANATIADGVSVITIDNNAPPTATPTPRPTATPTATPTPPVGVEDYKIFLPSVLR